MRSIKQEFIRYIGVGGISFIVDFMVLAVLASLLGVNYLIATALAFLFGTGANYTLSIHWVFSHRDVSNRYTEFSIFVFVGIITLGLSMTFISILVGWLGIHLLLAKCIATSLTLVANFAGRRILLFTRLDGFTATTISSTPLK
jgi:putative flippase GtrA